MTALAAFFLATGTTLAAAVVCIPLHRIAEVLSEIEIRSTGDYSPGPPEVTR